VLEQAMLPGPVDKVGAGSCLELAEELREMEPHRPVGDPQVERDLLIAQAVRYPLQDFHLARCWFRQYWCLASQDFRRQRRHG
jgi:hypothetical protein